MVKINQHGFTLIEVMLAVAIIAILAAVVYPSYSNYKIRAHRSEAQAEMIFIAHKMQTYKAVNNTYAGTTVNAIYGGTRIPKQGTALYNLAFNPSPTLANSWTLIATPIVGKQQAGNGVICLNDLGQKFWAKAATACSLSATSDWSGR